MDGAQVDMAVTRLSRHIVMALSRPEPDFEAYRQAFHLPFVGVDPTHGVDPPVLANLLDLWANDVALLVDLAEFAPAIARPPTVREALVAVLGAAAARDTAQSVELLSAVVYRMPAEDLWWLCYALAAGFTIAVGFVGGLDALDDVRCVLDPYVDPRDTHTGYVTALVIAALIAGHPDRARRALAVIGARRDGTAAIAAITTIAVQAAAEAIAFVTAAPITSVDDDRFPPDDNGGLAVLATREAIAGFFRPSAPGAPSVRVSPLPTLDDRVAAALYAARCAAVGIPALIRHLVSSQVSDLDPDRP